VTGVGACERERERARRINVEGTVAAAVQLVDEDVIPIFLSSDYVFDGLTGRYRECDPRRPVNEYGRFKALAEERLLERCKGNCLIVRLGKVYGLDAGDGTLLDDMARTLLRGDTLRAAVDQVFCPTFVGNVVEAVTAAQKTRTCGLVNFCAPDAWSRYDIACALADALGISRATVTPVSLDDLKEPFRRPKNTSMESTRPPLLERCMSIPDAVRIYAARIPKG
jgi:dTDP-4-dehydrorhamnose reductase